MGTSVPGVASPWLLTPGCYEALFYNLLFSPIDRQLMVNRRKNTLRVGRANPPPLGSDLPRGYAGRVYRRNGDFGSSCNSCSQAHSNLSDLVQSGRAQSTKRESLNVALTSRGPCFFCRSEILKSACSVCYTLQVSCGVGFLLTDLSWCISFITVASVFGFCALRETLSSGAAAGVWIAIDLYGGFARSTVFCARRY